MAYDIDQCAQCGGIRVAKSTLCADCLVACNHRLQGRIENQIVGSKRVERLLNLIVEKRNLEIVDLKYQLRIRWKLLQKIFTEYQNLLRLYKRDGVKLDAVNRVFR
jgi:hypothetical protein